MKQNEYTVQGKTADGTALAVCRVAFEGREKVHTETRHLLHEAKNRAYVEKLAGKCRITPH